MYSDYWKDEEKDDRIRKRLTPHNLRLKPTKHRLTCKRCKRLPGQIGILREKMKIFVGNLPSKASKTICVQALRLWRSQIRDDGSGRSEGNHEICVCDNAGSRGSECIRRCMARISGERRSLLKRVAQTQRLVPAGAKRSGASAGAVPLGPGEVNLVPGDRSSQTPSLTGVLLSPCYSFV